MERRYEVAHSLNTRQLRKILLTSGRKSAPTLLPCVPQTAKRHHPGQMDGQHRFIRQQEGMTMIKKVVIVSLLIAALTMLVGCGGQTQSQSSSQTQGSKSYKIVFIA